MKGETAEGYISAHNIYLGTVYKIQRTVTIMWRAIQLVYNIYFDISVNI